MAGSGHQRLRQSGVAGDRRGGVSGAIALPDRYQPLGLIARGRMASVWAARDRTLDREVAVKVLAERFAREEASVRRFEREARAAARLSGHPNVVTIYDVGREPASERRSLRRPLIVMEFLAAGTVADAARLGDADQLQAIAWLHAAAAALDHAHPRGVIHRDVKPSNFLLDEHRVLHVGDFGIASLGTDDTLTASGYLLGTAAYLAPERALGQPATPASDRYSLAVAAFELLVRARPFAAAEPVALARQHVEARPPAASSRNPALPAALDAVLERGLAKRPERRWQTAAALAGAIEEALAGARRSQRAPVAIPGRRRTRGTVAAALGAAALIVAVAAGGGGIGGSRRGPASAGRHATAHPPPPGMRRAAKRPVQRPAPPVATAAGSQAASTPPSAGSLEARGHGLMEAGNYAAAIPVLRDAVAAASPSSLTYAYALYDLGRSLRLSGDPQAAIPILSRRLAIPNQTGVVRAELRLALQAVGRGRPAPAQGTSGGATAAPHGRHLGHRGGDAGSGGAALSARD
jgi:eukaryotic-like serine/threonine-protein kinase